MGGLLLTVSFVFFPGVICIARAGERGGWLSLVRVSYTYWCFRVEYKCSDLLGVIQVSGIW